MPRAFVSGIAGFLGSHLADYLLMQGYEVTGCDDLSTGDPLNVKDTDIIWRKCSIEDLRADDFDDIDICWHVAALAHEGLSVFSPSLICRNIYGGSANVFSAAISAGVRRIVYCSSMARYGVGNPPFHETDDPNPVDPYGLSKLAAEQLLAILSQSHRIEQCVAVPHNIFGPRQKYDDPMRNVAAIFANRLLRGQQPIIYGDGHQVRCFSYIDDVVPSLARMGTHAAAEGQIINLGPERGEVTILDLARMLAEIIGVPCDPIFVPPRPREVKVAVCSAQKARDLLGFEQKTELRDGLVKLVEWLREKGPREFRYHLPIEINSPLTPETWKYRTM